ncbi:hypothetical protein [Salinicola avicenniae]|uniref:hypothetical protein n=1 Tax=Salinicola avicenniae TaxID=2916836 RepID=UPI002073E663|nr:MULTISPECIES: hypothetical protein [unclassified Salinicola]
MKLFLHPGHAKCGSTSIQRAIVRNRQVLADQGIIVPDHHLRLPGEAGFEARAETPRDLFRRLKASGDLGELEKRLQVWRKTPSLRDVTLVISAENLINHLMQPIGRQLHGLLADAFDEVEVIYYIRRQDDYLLAAWQQWGFKEGKGFEAYCEQARQQRNPHYLAIGQAFGSLYGREHVTIRPLMPEALRGGDLLSDFFSRLGVPSTTLEPAGPRSNLSWNPYLCRLLVEQPALFRDIHDDALKQFLQAKLGPGSALFSREADFVDPALARSIMEHHAAENRQLQQQFFPLVDYEAVFGLPTATATTDTLRREKIALRESELQRQVLGELLAYLHAVAVPAKTPA